VSPVRGPSGRGVSAVRPRAAGCRSDGSRPAWAQRKARSRRTHGPDLPPQPTGLPPECGAPTARCAITPHRRSPPRSPHARNLTQRVLPPSRSQPRCSITTSVPPVRSVKVISTSVASARSRRRCQRYPSRCGGSQTVRWFPDGHLAPVVLDAVRGALEDAPADAGLEHDVEAGDTADGVVGGPPRGNPPCPDIEGVCGRTVHSDRHPKRFNPHPHLYSRRTV
jgi:hypothetical protein